MRSLHICAFRIEDLLQEKSHHEKDRYQTNDIKANITEQSGFGDTQSGFGDTITMPERNTYASFIPFTQKNETIKTFELNTSVNFTPYSQESSSVSSKLDDTDTMTLTSDDEVFNTSKQESAFEVSPCRYIIFRYFFTMHSFRDMLHVINSIKKFVVMTILKGP